MFDSSAGDPGVPKSRFAYLFPSANSAMVQVRLSPDLSDAQRRRAIDLFETAAEQRGVPAAARGAATWSPACRWSREGLADAVQRSIFVLLARRCW